MAYIVFFKVDDKSQDIPATSSTQTTPVKPATSISEALKQSQAVTPPQYVHIS